MAASTPGKPDKQGVVPARIRRFRKYPSPSTDARRIPVINKDKNTKAVPEAGEVLEADEHCDRCPSVATFEIGTPSGNLYFCHRHYRSCFGSFIELGYKVREWANNSWRSIS